MSVRRFVAAFVLGVLCQGCGSSAIHAASRAGVAPEIQRATSQLAEPLDPKFFARRSVQARAPKAFSLMPEAQAGLRAMEKEAGAARFNLVNTLQGNPQLYVNIKRFPALTWEARLAVLRSVFDVECKVLRIKAPELVISTTEIKGPAYFDFDPAKPGAGRVILNPDAIAKDANPWTALLLLIHETRHSAQFQMAFETKSDQMGARALDPDGQRSLLRDNYRAAFVAQKSFSGDLNFSDFCSLNNEYDAFRFGNFVVGALTRWQVDTLDMGCFSSQFDKLGNPRIDLIALGNQVGPAALLDAFNERQTEQYRLLKSAEKAQSAQR